jgi:hypothetical protein
VHRFLTPGVGSEFASYGIQSDRFFAGSTGNYLGERVAPGLLFKPVSKNIRSAVTSSAGKRSSRFGNRFGGVLMLLKMIVLSSSALVLWLAPLVGLDKKVGWHKSIQGLSLSAAVACAVSAGNIGHQLADESEIQELKTRAIKADVEDEIATEVYVSQAQRQQKAEQILNAQPETKETVEALKRAWLLDCAEPETEEIEPTESSVQRLNPPQNNTLVKDEETFTSLNLTQNQAIELIKKMRSELNLNQKDIIEKLWACTKGGSNDWKKARAQFKELTGE